LKGLYVLNFRFEKALSLKPVSMTDTALIYSFPAWPSVYSNLTSAKLMGLLWLINHVDGAKQFCMNIFILERKTKNADKPHQKKPSPIS